MNNTYENHISATDLRIGTYVAIKDEKYANRPLRVIAIEQHSVIRAKLIDESDSSLEPIWVDIDCMIPYTESRYYHRDGSIVDNDNDENSKVSDGKSEIISEYATYFGNVVRKAVSDTICKSISFLYKIKH